MSETRKHAILSPSAAHRWTRCTPSALAESAMSDESSVYAREGSLAHAICARTILRALGRDTADADAEIAELTPEFPGSIAEMEEHADTYADIVLRAYIEEQEQGRAEIHIETALDLSEWAPGSFGTSDAVVVGPSTLHVFDFKYGRGVQVDAEGNAQMQLYALGALDEFGTERAIAEVQMTIVQPRLGAVSTAAMPRDTLLEWGNETLRPLAECAIRGLGPRYAGSWCKFCKAAGTCTALDTLAGAAMVLDVDRASAHSLGTKCLPMCGPLEIWIEDVKSRALAALIRGEKVPGYKSVRKRGRRVISDPDGLADKLQGAGVEADKIYRPQELKTIGELEKAVGKSDFARLSDGYVTKTVGDLTIAADSDRRQATTGADAFEGIEIE